MIGIISVTEKGDFIGDKLKDFLKKIILVSKEFIKVNVKIFL